MIKQVKKSSAQKPVAKAEDKTPYVKGSHNRAAKSKFVVPPHRITPEGFKRGTEVRFNIDLDSVFHKAYPDFDMQAKYPAYSMNEKYIVISVFQPSVTNSGRHEVTLRNLNGDCYGYVESQHLVFHTEPAPTQEVNVSPVAGDENAPA